MARRRREVPTPELRCPTCRAELDRFWAYCPDCGRRLEWRDTARQTGAEFLGFFGFFSHGRRWYQPRRGRATVAYFPSLENVARSTGYDDRFNA